MHAKTESRGRLWGLKPDFLSAEISIVIRTRLQEGFSEIIWFDFMGRSVEMEGGILRPSIGTNSADG